MRLFLDEHLSDRVSEALRARGFDVVNVLEVDLGEADDEVIWKWAIREGRILVSYDVGDFPTLFADFFHRGVEHPGLVVISSDTIAQWDLGGQVRALERLLRRDPDLGNQMIFLEPA